LTLLFAVANSQNTLVWNCKESQFDNFTVLYVSSLHTYPHLHPFFPSNKLITCPPCRIANSNQNILVAPQAIIAVQNNFDCSKSITTQQANLPVSTGYTVQLANPINSTQVYAESEPFEVKAQGSAYPDPSATPTGTPTGGAGGNGGTGTQTGDNAQDTNTNAASVLTAGGAIAGVVGLVASVAGLL
jgi:hypothetical protein